MLVLIEVEENVVALAAWISGRSTGGSMTAVSGRARRHPSKNNRTHNDFLTFLKFLHRPVELKSFCDSRTELRILPSCSNTSSCLAKILSRIYI